MGGYISAQIAQNCVVFQGDPLSPLLFILYVAELADILREVLVLIIYAGDLAIVSPNIECIQRALIKIKIFCDQHKLSVKMSKTKAMKIGAGGSATRRIPLTHEGVTIEYVNHFSFLGVEKTTGDTGSRHIKMLYKKGINSINLLNATLEISKFSFSSAERLIRAIIIPSCTYGLSVFEADSDDPKQAQHMHKVIAYFWKR